ncbi:MAG: NAD(P)/FAD-dependent oxidoreductase [Synergistaceae bacterium]|jgi:glycerol-3-phosphate dehydrogenase|nr:NAD(P)/FAD-dependent oxidoreductase [Synergistaceae bacterium]
MPRSRGRWILGKEIFDAAIIGAGVVGCAIARELSRFELNVCVIEKEPDVSFGTSSRNSGVLHSGINYEPDTKRARLSVRGNGMMDALCADLKVQMKRIGKLTVALSREDLPGLNRLRERGAANGVSGMEMLDSSRMSKIQPGIAGIFGLWTPSSAVISPYGLTIALAENARANGVRFFLGCEVSGIRRESVFADDRADKDYFCVSFQNGLEIRSSVLINAAGLHADEISRMAGVNAPPVWACRGEYFVLDKRLDGTLKTLVYPVPGQNDPGLGIHLTPTVDGNILIGPSAAYIPDEYRESYRVTDRVMPALRREGGRMLPGLAASDFIRSFAGNRPKLTPPERGGNGDFIIEEAEDRPGFIHLLGIESPGLTSAPAIAEDVRDLVGARIELRKKDDFIAHRSGCAGRFADLPGDERAYMANIEPEYGEIVCRCESITKKEVRDAIENPFGARGLSGIKYRSRAMMGRCQGGFCVARIVRMLREEYGYGPEDFLMNGPNSRLFSGFTREPDRTPPADSEDDG